MPRYQIASRYQYRVGVNATSIAAPAATTPAATYAQRIRSAYLTTLYMATSTATSYGRGPSGPTVNTWASANAATAAITATGWRRRQNSATAIAAPQISRGSTAERSVRRVSSVSSATPTQIARS